MWTYVVMGAHSFKFDDESELMLRSFCEASNDANMQAVVIHALKSYISSELLANEGIQQRYNEIRKRRTGENIRLVSNLKK